MGSRLVAVAWAAVLVVTLVGLGASGESSAGTAAGATVGLSPAGNDSSCARGAANRPCRTFQRAYDVAQPGDTVVVAAGSYPADDPGRNSVTIFGDRRSTEPVTFSCASKGAVTHTSKFFTIVAYNVKVVGSCFRLHGVNIGEGGDSSVTTDGVTVEGVHMDALDVAGARRVLIKNVELGPNVYCYAQGRTGVGPNGGPITPAMWCDPKGPAWESFYSAQGSEDMAFQLFLHSNSAGIPPTVVMEDSYVHDLQTKDAFNLHTGCGLVWTRTGLPASTIVFRNNRFENCAVQGIQFTQTDGVTVTGNWFGHPIEPLSNGVGDDVEADGAQREISLATEPGWSPRNYLISFNSFDHGISLDNSEIRPGYTNVVVRRNVLGTNSYCPPGVAFESNLFEGEACGTDALTVPFGYLLKEDRLVPEKRDAATVKMIFAAVATGKTPATVAKELRKASRGAWSAVSVRKVVENDFYLGSRVGPKGAHPALVSRKILQRAQRSLPR